MVFKIFILIIWTLGFFNNNLEKLENLVIFLKSVKLMFAIKIPFAQNTTSHQTSKKLHLG